MKEVVDLAGAKRGLDQDLVADVLEEEIDEVLPAAALRAGD